MYSIDGCICVYMHARMGVYMYTCTVYIHMYRWIDIDMDKSRRIDRQPQTRCDQNGLFSRSR